MQSERSQARIHTVQFHLSALSRVDKDTQAEVLLGLQGTVMQKWQLTAYGFVFLWG